MLRRLFTVLSALSLVLFLLTVVAWALGRWNLTLWLDETQQVNLNMDSNGNFWIERYSGYPTLTTAHPNVRQQEWMVPAFMILLLTSILPARWLVRRWVQLKWQQRRERNLCPSCSYDLRATPDRCPECGYVSTVGQDLDRRR